MKVKLIIIVSLFCVNFGFAQTPVLNKKVVEYIDSKMGKKVDRGECWDLANMALKHANADLPSLYVFGRRFSPRKEKVYPGDILQFSKVKVKYQKGRTTFKESMMHHTAIVYKVVGKGKFILAEQNGSAGRKVATTKLDLSTVVGGKIKFYRPISKK